MDQPGVTVVQLSKCLAVSNLGAPEQCGDFRRGGGPADDPRPVYDGQWHLGTPLVVSDRVPVGPWRVCTAEALLRVERQAGTSYAARVAPTAGWVEVQRADCGVAQRVRPRLDLGGRWPGARPGGPAG